MYENQCEFCGAFMDPGERCDCNGVSPKPKKEPQVITEQHQSDRHVKPRYQRRRRCWPEYWRTIK